jgi:hypothetical protein
MVTRKVISARSSTVSAAGPGVPDPAPKIPAAPSPPVAGGSVKAARTTGR